MMITTTGVVSRRSMLPPATAIPIPVAGGDALDLAGMAPGLPRPA
jgi:hypothetical protein